LLDFDLDALVFATTPFLLTLGLTLNFEDEDVFDLDTLAAIYLVLVYLVYLVFSTSNAYVLV
jgi:hypothetical protein